LGSWGGISNLTAANGGLAGRWSYGEQSGQEIWTPERVIGVEMSLNVWSKARSGPLVLIFDET